MRILKLLSGTALLFVAACSGADSAPADTNDAIAQDVAAENNASYNAAQKAYHAANNRMHAGMNIINEDADVAFIQGMIPHHQGAVEMANIILEHGDDEEAKALARDIIAAQEKEIAWMKSWLKKRGLDEIKIDDEAVNAIDHEAMGH